MIEKHSHKSKKTPKKSHGKSITNNHKHRRHFKFGSFRVKSKKKHSSKHMFGHKDRTKESIWNKHLFNPMTQEIQTCPKSTVNQLYFKYNLKQDFYDYSSYSDSLLQNKLDKHFVDKFFNDIETVEYYKIGHQFKKLHKTELFIRYFIIITCLGLFIGSFCMKQYNTMIPVAVASIILAIYAITCRTCSKPINYLDKRSQQIKAKLEKFNIAHQGKHISLSTSPNAGWIMIIDKWPDFHNIGQFQNDEVIPMKANMLLGVDMCY